MLLPAVRTVKTPVCPDRTRESRQSASRQRRRTLSRRLGVGGLFLAVPLGALAVAVGIGEPATLRPEPGSAARIQHAPVHCVVKDRFAAIEASIEGGPELSRVRLYFRSPYEPDFLYVDMTVVGGRRFVGVLPRPRPKASPVTYFIEAAKNPEWVERSPAVVAQVVGNPGACGIGRRVADDAGGLADIQVYSMGTSTELPAGFGGVAAVRPALRTPAKEDAMAAVVAPPSEESSAGSRPPEYALGKDDILRVTVFGHDDLAQTVVIQADGTIDFPMIGRIPAQGLSPRALEQRLAEALRTFVRSPQVSVTVQEYRSKTVFVVGEVARPGTYPLSGNMSVMEALAKAGAAGGVGVEVLIVRPSGEVDGPVLPAEGVTAEILRVDLRDIQMGQLQKNILLRPNDTVFVGPPAKVFVTGEVRSPGAIPYHPGITARQVIGMAGGLSPEGSSGRLQVVRMVGGKSKTFKIGIDDPVQSGDTLVVRARLF
jgi:polysaccharide export outer membrane protein